MAKKSNVPVAPSRGGAGEPGSAGSTAMIRLPGLELEIPATLDGVMAQIGEAERSGRKLALAVTVYVAHVRDTYYKDDATGWLEAMKEKFGYERRFCFTCLAVGRSLVRQCRTLPPDQVKGLLGTGIYELEWISHIPDHLLPVFLKNHPTPSTLGREAIKTLTKCYAEGKTAKEIEAAEDQIAEAKLQKKTAKTDKTPATERAIRTLVSLMADQQSMAAASKDIDPMTAIQAGFCALQLALNSLECNNVALNADQFRVVGHLSMQFEQELIKHKPQES